MNQKLNQVLLVDDDDATNFINKMIFKRVGYSGEIASVQNGLLALDYIKSGKHQLPNLILLDINMPSMNGWEFLVEYQKLSKEQRGSIVIIMLTTSENPDDEIKANNIPDINDFQHKSLTVEILQNLLEKHFS